MLTNRLFHFAFLWTGLLLSQMLHAQTTVTLGYCPDELTANAHSLVMSEKASFSVHAAIKIPGARLQFLKGATLTKIRIATEEGMSGTYVWVRPSIEEPGTLSLTRLGTTVDGWNEVTLKNPYTVTGEDIYIGFNGTLQAGKGIYFDGEANPNAAYVGNGVTWNNAYEEGQGSLCIQAIVEADESIPTSDVAVESCTFNKEFTKKGDNVEATFALSNYGVTAANMPKLFYSLNNGEQAEVAVDGTLAASETRTFTATIPTANAHEGFNDLHIWIEAEDGYLDNNTLDKKLCCYETAFPHKVLVEHFTTLPCVNCPYGHTALHNLLDGRDDYVWVAHHVGYSEDELTIQDSYDISSPLGVSSAPLATFDRAFLSISQSATSPAFGVAIYYSASGREQLLPIFEERAATPAFVSVNISNTFDKTTRLLTTTVTGERTPLLSIFYPENSLTVQLVEDKVKTEAAQKGDGEKVHDNVYRQSLTNVKGDAVEWNGETYSRTFTCILPEGWKEENLRVAAFVGQPVGDDVNALEILNANQLAVEESSTSSIGNALDSTGDTTTHEYFNLAGQRIATPQEGVYLERIATSNGTKTLKRVR